MLSLSLREDNEHTMSQAFSCCSVVLSVYVWLCAHVSVWSGKKISWCVCVFVLNLCVLATGGAEVRALREELIRIPLTEQSYHQLADCLDNITTATTAFYTPELELHALLPQLSLSESFKESLVSSAMFGCSVNVYLFQK